MTAVRTPLSHTTALALGNKLWRKQVLKQGTIHYRGGTFDASPEYLDEVVAAFQDNAIGSVPFVFVDDTGAHSESPRHRKGNVVGLERTPDGIDAILSLDDDANELVAKDKKFGVSVLIKHDRTTGGGKRYPAVLAHVAGTYDPVINDLGDWEELAASNDGDVLDLLSLTSITAPTEGSTVADNLTPEETAAVRSVFPLIAKLIGADEPAEPATAVVEPADDNPADQPFTDGEPDGATPVDSDTVDEDTEDTLSEADIQKLVDDVLAEPEPELIAASQDDSETLRLSHEVAQERQAREDLELRLAQAEAREAEKDFTAERDLLAREYGIAPHLTNIIAPLLKGGGGQVALSNGDQARPGDLVRQFVKELAQVGFLDLSHPVGSAIDRGPEQVDEASKRAEQVADYMTNILGL